MTYSGGRAADGSGWNNADHSERLSAVNLRCPPVYHPAAACLRRTESTARFDGDWRLRRPTLMPRLLVSWTFNPSGSSLLPADFGICRQKDISLDNRSQFGSDNIW